jgi:hypothetical protein
MVNLIFIQNLSSQCAQHWCLEDRTVFRAICCFLNAQASGGLTCGGLRRSADYIVIEALVVRDDA